MSSRNITLVSDYFPPSTGGMENHVYVLAEWLVRRNHSVNVVTRKIPEPRLANSSIRIHDFPSVFSKYHWFMRGYDLPLIDPLFGLSAIVQSALFRNAVVHVHGTSTLSIFPHKKLTDFSIVVTFHDYWPVCFRRNLMSQAGDICDLKEDCSKCLSSYVGRLSRFVPVLMNLNSMLLESFDEVGNFIAVSDFLKKTLAKRGLPAKRIEVIHNWIDLSKSNSYMKSSIPKKRENTVLYVGSITRAKGVHHLIDVVSLVAKEVPDFHLRVVGSGVMLPALERRVKREGLSRSVSFAGRITKSELIHEYRKAKVFVCPSVWPEPCPTVILDAMAFRLPIIASNVGGIPELVQDAVNGFLLSPRTVRSELPDRLAALLTDDDLCEKIGAVNFKKVKENFDIEAQLDSLLRVYDEVAE